MALCETFTNLLAPSSLESFQIYSTTLYLKIEALSQMNLLFRHIAEAHANTIRRFSVHRIYTSFDTVQTICNLCHKSEELFVSRKLQPTGGSMVRSDFFQNKDVTCLSYPGKISNGPLEFEKSSYVKIPVTIRTVVFEGVETFTSYNHRRPTSITTYPFRNLPPSLLAMSI